MTTSSKTILLKDIMEGEFSRKKAVLVRNNLLSSLTERDTLNIDLSDSNFTPSVADELIGGIATYLGAEQFKKQIHIMNASESQRALMRHVMARRLSKKSNN